VLDRIRRLRPATVVLSTAWEQYPDDSLVTPTVRKLRRLGIGRIVVVGPVPKWPQGMPQALYDVYLQKHRLPVRLTFGMSNDPRKADDVVRPLAQRRGVVYVAPLDILCNAQGCLARLGPGLDQLVVWDTAHFTVAGSVYFARAAASLLFGPR
jgi:hypothetical protein